MTHTLHAPRRPSPLRWTIALVALLLFALAGCGSGGGENAVSPPTVKTLASVVEVDIGEPAVLLAEASGSAPLSYQWQRDGLDIQAATTAAYVIAEVSPLDAGSRFRVKVRNSAGEVVSNETLLKVNGATPTVVGLLQVAVASPGQRIAISTKLAGNPPFTYQWLRNDQAIDGAAGTTDSNTLQFVTESMAEADDGVRFALTIRTAEGSSRSPDALISVIAPPRVAAGGAHSLARSADGTVWAWGDNQFGQLGLGSTASTSVPTVINGLSGIKAVAAGTDHSVALKGDGTVWAWGRNASGALGDGTLTDRHSPQPVGGLSDIIAIAAGNGRTFALRGDGSLWGWGENSTGALGLGNQNNTMSPTRIGQSVIGFSSIVAVAAGARHTLALRADGSVYIIGEVAVPPPNGPTVVMNPTLLDGPVSTSGIAAGNGLSIAVDINGRLWSWGVNGSGQLGLGDTSARALPQPIQLTQSGTGLLPSLRLAAGDDFVAVRSLGGSILSWGADASGQLGDGSASTGTTAPIGVANLTSILEIAAGKAHALAVRADGAVYSWGANTTGQLGLGSSETQRSEPVQVPGLNLN